MDLEPGPELFQDLTWIWEGFRLLSRCRQWGTSGPLPLQLGELMEYTTLHSISDPDDLIDFINFAKLLDEEWLSDWYKKSEIRSKSNSKTGSRSRKR